MLSQDQFFALSSLLKDETAVVLETGKEYLVESRLSCLMREEGFATLSELIDTVLMRSNPGLNQKVLMALTTNETSFFRDLAAFELLKNTALPELLKARASTRTLTVWSAACSTGQEPYSLAISLRESIPDFGSWKVKIVASDLNPTVVARASRGVFSSLEVNRGLPVQLLLKHFTQDGDNYHLNKEVKSMVTFFEQNLIGDWPPGPVDVFFMRNVLIYFDTETKRRIFEKAKATLAPDGYLFLGTAETPCRIVDGFCKVPGATNVYRKEPKEPEENKG
jgi:chemotaxis protein methyltransferase CheR